MRIGITYNLKDPAATNLPDDHQEEFDSPETIESLARVLRDLGHQAELLGDGPEMVNRLLASPPDFVFNIAEGTGVSRSREARTPALLEMLGIPYTGSDPLTLAATLDKDWARRLVQSAGVVCPVAVSLSEHDSLQALLEMPELPLPAVVKPCWEGSSKGIRDRCLVDNHDELIEVVRALRREHRQPILIEEFIEGDEVTVGVLGNNPPRVLGVLQVIPKRKNERFIYSLEAKRDWQNRVSYECPPRLPEHHVAAIEAAALRAYKVLNCRDVARVDFRLRGGIPYFLEANPLPGLNAVTGDLVILARARGMSHQQLIETILQGALDRHAAGSTAAAVESLQSAV
jgi:D-alanine-D-alanine ligase